MSRSNRKQPVHLIPLDTTKPNRPQVVELTRKARWKVQDPILVELCTLIIKSGLTPREISAKITIDSGGGAFVAARTIERWLDGSTYRPQNFTLDTVAAAIGYGRSKWVPLDASPRPSKRPLRRERAREVV
jgi:hypothetical protein